MELVNMARESEPGEKAFGGIPTATSPYPYSLRLNITHEELGKLGYTELPPAGTELHMEAKCVVVRATTEDPDADGDVDYCCIEVQIKELGLEEEETADGEGEEDKTLGRAERMYERGKQKA
jgi:hypothetical protein